MASIVLQACHEARCNGRLACVFKMPRETEGSTPFSPNGNALTVE